MNGLKIRNSFKVQMVTILGMLVLYSIFHIVNATVKIDSMIFGVLEGLCLLMASTGGIFIFIDIIQDGIRYK